MLVEELISRETRTRGNSKAVENTTELPRSGLTGKRTTKIVLTETTRSTETVVVRSL